MRRVMLKAKIHLATVTAARVDYEGSITLDPLLMAEADILPFEQVHVLDVDNGARVVTYAIEGETGSGEVQINGAAARLVAAGDRVIVLSYAEVDEPEIAGFMPRVVHVGEGNLTRLSPSQRGAEMDWKDWVDRAYEAVDRKDPDGYAAFLTDDASFRFGNADPVKGREAVREAVAGFFGSLAGLRHTFTGRWKKEEEIILQGEVEYTRLDGGKVTLPFVTINGMEGGLAHRVEIYIDPAPLYAP